MNASESEVRQGKGKERERRDDWVENLESPKSKSRLRGREGDLQANSSHLSRQQQQQLATRPTACWAASSLQGAHFRDRTVTTARPVSPCRHTGHLPASLILIYFYFIFTATINVD